MPPSDAPRIPVLVLTRWTRRWEFDNQGGLADDYYFLKTFIDNGFEFHFVCPRDPNPVDIPFDHYYVHAFPDFVEATRNWPTMIRRVLWPALFAVLSLVRAGAVVRRVRPRLVLGQTEIAAVPVFFLSRLLRVPSVLKLFGVVDLGRFDWPRFKYIRKNLEQIVAVRIPQDCWIILDDGTGGKEAAMRHGVPENRIRFLPNGVNVEWGSGEGAAGVFDCLGIARDTRVVLYLARLVDWKRPDAFVRAAARVLELTGAPVVFVVAGEGPARSRCEQLARELGVSAHVRFAGPIPHADVPRVMSGCAVFVATNMRSNKSIPTCEAMVCGLPVVAFDTGDTRDVVHDGDTGRLVKDGDVGALAAAVVDLLRDEEERTCMARRAREFARRNFVGWPERTKMELDVVRTLLGRSAPPRDGKA